MPTLNIAGPAPNGLKPRNWDDWDGRTFLDLDTGGRVYPDGTPATPPAPGRGNVPIEDIDTGPIPSEVPERDPYAEAQRGLYGGPGGGETVVEAAGRGIKAGVERYGFPALERYEAGARPIRERIVNPIGEALDRSAAMAAVLRNFQAVNEIAQAGGKPEPLPEEFKVRPGESTKDYAQRIFETNPFPEGAIGLERALLDPFNIAPFGVEKSLARGVVAGGRVAGRAAGRVAGEALETARPIARTVGRHLASERGALDLGPIDDMLHDLGRKLDDAFEQGDEAAYNDLIAQKEALERVREELPAYDPAVQDELADMAKQTRIEFEDAAKKETLATNPVLKYLYLVDRTGDFKGQVPETVSDATYRKLTGHAPLPTSRVRRTGRVDAHDAVDEAASALGMSPDEFITEVNSTYKMWSSLPPRDRPPISPTAQPRGKVERISGFGKREPTVQQGALEGPPKDTFQTERELQGFRESQGALPVPERPVEPPISQVEAPTPASPVEPGATPLTRDEIRQASELKIGITRGKEAEIREAIAAGGKPPGEPPIPPSGPTGSMPAGSPLERLHKMWDDGAKTPTFWEKVQQGWASLPDKYRGFQEAWTDRYAGLNALNPRVERVIARLGGIGEMQTQRSADIAKAVKTALGPLWKDADKHLDDYLHLKHVIDIEAVKGPQRLIPGGIKGASEAQQALSDLQTLLGPQRWQQLEQGANAAFAESKRVLEDMVSEGLVSRELADTLEAQYPHYNRMNIIRETQEISSSAVGRNKISVTSNNLKRLTEEGTEKARTSPYSSIIGSAVDAEAMIARNRAAREAATELINQGMGKRISGARPVAQVEGEAIFRRPAGDIKNTISYMENGERVLVEVPEWAAKEALAIAKAGDSDVVRAISTINSLPKSAFVTYNPRWPAANLVIDYFTATLQHQIGPIAEFKGLWEAVKDLSGNSEVLAKMRRSGGGQAGWFAPDAAKIQKLVKDSGNLAITSEKEWLSYLKDPGKLLRAPFKAVRTVGQVMEQGTRAAVFSKVAKRTGSLDEAAFAARRSTIDFARGGWAAKGYNAVSIFFNAGLQGTLLAPRVLRDSPRARWALGTAMGANAMLYAYNRQFEEYEDVPADVKRGSMILMLPSDEYDTQGRLKPRYIAILPKVREWGLFFGTMNYILEELDGKAHEGLGRFLATQMSQSTPIDTGLVTGALTVPGEVAVEQLANYDFYRNKPIVPPEMQGLPAAEQYTPYTSATIKGVAQMLGLSPMRLQAGFYGLTGGAGQTVTSITDALLQTISPSEVDFRIAELAHELDQIKAPDVPPDEVALRRIEFLNGLNAKDRQAVLDLNRQPQEQIPIISGILARFYGERGGELYRLGQEAAQAQTGKSPQQTQQASKALGGLADILKEEQEAQDAHLAANPGMAEQWRKAHTEKAIKYQGALQQLGVLYPGAAQLGEREDWTAYQSAVYTLAGAEPDRRTKGQILAAGYRAIPLESADPLTKDFDTFFKRRAEYKAALSPEDSDLLERTLQASMTPTEKQYAKDQETLRPYWEVLDKVRERYPKMLEFIDKATLAEQTNDPKFEGMKQDPRWKFYKKAVDAQRCRLRLRDKAVQQAGFKWDHFGKITQDTIDCAAGK